MPRLFSRRVCSIEPIPHFFTRKEVREGKFGLMLIIHRNRHHCVHIRKRYPSGICTVSGKRDVGVLCRPNRYNFGLPIFRYFADARTAAVSARDFPALPFKSRNADLEQFPLHITFLRCAKNVCHDVFLPIIVPGYVYENVFLFAILKNRCRRKFYNILKILNYISHALFVLEPNSTFGLCVVCPNRVAGLKDAALPVCFPRRPDPAVR